MMLAKIIYIHLGMGGILSDRQQKNKDVYYGFQRKLGQ